MADEMRWRIYYGDGSTYDSRDGAAWNAPARDCQMVAVADPDHGWFLCRSDDFYWYVAASDEWVGGDNFGLWDYLIEPGPKRVLFGRTISNAQFQAIFERACAEWTKTGFRPHEQRPADGGSAP
jgi:hypothetical protein